MKKIIIGFSFLLVYLNAFEIKSVHFDGLLHMSQESASQISGLEKGSWMDYELSQKAIKNLFNQGYFSDIVIEHENEDVRVFVQEKPIVAMIEFEGISDEDKKILKEVISLKKGMNYDKNNIDQAKLIVVKFFESKGYFDTVVEESHTPLEEDTSLKVLFKINRGEEITITSIKTPGAKILTYKDFEPVIMNKQRDFFGWMWGFNDGKLKLEALPIDSEKIKDLYYTRGFLDAQISKPFLKLYNDNYKADIVYKIEEGEPYSVKNIELELPDDVIDAQKTQKKLKLKADKTFDISKMREDMKMIENQVANKGYAFAKVVPQTPQDQLAKTIDIKYSVNLGEKVYINKVIISGNTRTADHVIRRELYLTEGELFNQTNLNDSKYALRRTGYFDDVNIAQKQISDNQVDLIVSVVEAPTGSITGGLGYGTSQGIIFDIGVSDKNIFGSGISGTIRGSRSEDELSGIISFENPRVFDTRFSLGGSLYAEDNDWSGYDERIYGASITTGRKIGRNFNVYLQYTLEKVILDNIDIDMRDVGHKNGDTIKSSIAPSFIFNNTDDYFLPRKGFIFSSNFEYAGLGGDAKFMKSISNFKTFYGLRNWIGYDAILRYKARFRWIKDSGLLPINERLYLGGIDSVRGFESRSIGPKTVRGNDLGGTKSFNNSVEISFPLVDKLKMRWSAFYDYGMIGNSKLNDFARSSAGVALEWNSPLGAINLIFAKAIDPFPRDETNVFEFSIGRAF